MNSGEDSIPAPTSPELEAVLDAALPSPSGGFLLVLAGEHPGRVFPLTGRERVIGRGKDADIRIDQGSVSQRHARIVMGESCRYSVADLGSTNGTFVNGKAITSEVELRGGDVIRVGETALTFLVPESDEGDLPTVAIEHVPMDRMALRRLSRSVGRAALGGQRDASVRLRGDDEGISFHDGVAKLVRGYRFARRNALVFAASAAVFALIGASTARLLPPRGTAVFDVRLTPKASEGLFGTRDEQSTVEFFASSETAFSSPDLVRKTLVDIGPRAPNEEEVAVARANLRFEGVAQATYRGTYRDVSSDRAVRFLDRHVKNYVETEIDKTLRVMRAQVVFLDGQLAQNEKELSGTELAMKKHKESHIDGLPEQAREQLTHRLALKQRQTELSSEVERLGMELSAAKKRVGADDVLLPRRVQSSVPYEQAAVDARRKLGEARAAGLGDLHPEVQRLTREAAELDRLSRQALATDLSDVTRRADPTLQAMRNRVLDLQVAQNASRSELARISTELSKVDKVVRELPDVEAKYAELTRSYEATKELHDKLFERYKTAELGLELERASAAARYEILTPPEVVRISQRKLVLTRAALGAVGGVAFALMALAVGALVRYVREHEF